MVPGTRANERPLRWGILGCGGIARTVAAAIRSVPGCALHAVASRSLERAQAFAAQTGAPLACGDYAALARCAEVDVVYVATPPACHAADSLQCLDHGKHVLCEKPFAMSVTEAGAMAQRARERGCFLMEAMWTRFLPAIALVERLLADGRIGTPQLLLAGGAFKPAFDPSYYLFRPDLGGGVLRDAGVYLVHAAHWLLGRPVEVRSICQAGVQGVDEQDGVLLGFSTGALALLHVSMRAMQRPGLELLGSEGTIRLLPPVFDPAGVELSSHAGAHESWTFEPGPTGYSHQIAEVAQCIREGRAESARMPLSLTMDVLECLGQILSEAPGNG